VSDERVGALEIGGGHLSAARVDVATASVEPSTRCRIPLEPGAGRDELLDEIRRAATSVAASRLGVAVPGPFDYASGVSKLEHKLEAIYGVDLRRELTIALDLEPEAIVFLNDADAFLLGESWAGAARGHERAVGVTLGTGLGSAFLEDGRIVDSGPRVPPEGSLHLPTFRAAPVEDAISGRALSARHGAGLAPEQIAERARAGDARARACFAAFARDLAEVLEPWVAAFAPTCVVVGGSIARAWDLLGSELEPAFPGVTVTAAAQIDDAPLLGAAHCAVR
jgi:predicted NBD/HSP70 family sugar kinase